jgi:hypothetical protein
MPVAPVVLPIAGGRNSGPRRPEIRLTQQIFEANPNGSFGAEPEAADLQHELPLSAGSAVHTRRKLVHEAQPPRAPTTSNGGRWREGQSNLSRAS